MPIKYKTITKTEKIFDKAICDNCGKKIEYNHNTCVICGDDKCYHYGTCSRKLYELIDDYEHLQFEGSLCEKHIKENQKTIDELIKLRKKIDLMDEQYDNILTNMIRRKEND